MAEWHKAHPEYETLGIFAGYGDCDPRPHFVPSECGTDHCTDKWCPYPHGSGWKISGLEGLFSTEQDAINAFRARAALEVSRG